MAIKSSSKTAPSPAAKNITRAKRPPSMSQPKAAPAPTNAKAAAMTKPLPKTATPPPPLSKRAQTTRPLAAMRLAENPSYKPIPMHPAATVASAKPKRSEPDGASNPLKELSPHGLIKGKHIVCFWKQNDLGLFGLRPDRWIALWEQDPKVEKVLVFETPMSHLGLEEWLKRAVTLDSTSGSEYRLLLDQAVAKLQGHCDTDKTTYKTYLTPANKPADNQDYLRWVLQQVKEQGISAPTLVLWPACFANAALVKAIKPKQIITDLVDDQRLFPANAQLVPTITAQYQLWMGLSDVVLSNSLGLIKAFSQEFDHADIAYLSNQALAVIPAKKAAEPTAKKRKVVGFVGNMRELMDTAALLKAMAENRDKDFWFVGQTHGSAIYAKARNQPNAKFWGTLRQTEAEAVVAQFDVVVAPKETDRLTDGAHPLEEHTGTNSAIPLIELAALKKL